MAGWLQGLYWTLPRDRVEELFEEEVEEEEQAVEGADLEASKTKKDMDDDNAPAGLERAPTLVRCALTEKCTL